METMGDLLEKVQEFAFTSYTKEEATGLFGWPALDISVRGTKDDETHITITFENNLVLYINYFLNLDPTETEDTCELTLGLRTDLRSRIRYNVFYSGYIHGQGYLRLQMEETDNRMLQRMLEDFYVPALKFIYKPIIISFKGFYSKDFFGADAGHEQGEIYYSAVRYRSEHKASKIWDVIARLHELDNLLKEPEIKHALAELDVKLSFLPSILGSSL